jgi:hypothetical protein
MQLPFFTVDTKFVGREKLLNVLEKRLFPMLFHVCATQVNELVAVLDVFLNAVSFGGERFAESACSDYEIPRGVSRQQIVQIVIVMFVKRLQCHACKPPETSGGACAMTRTPLHQLIIWRLFKGKVIT